MKQVFIGKEPKEELFSPIKNDLSFVKPHGGLWTSPFDEENKTCGWVDWCLSEQLEWLDKDWWLITPDDDLNIYIIDSVEDVKELVDKNNLENSYISWLACIDFEGLRDQEKIDVVHLTEEGQWKTRLVQKYSLYGWDCECWLWLNWKIKSVRNINEIRDKKLM